jgi:hypothetical protein
MKTTDIQPDLGNASFLVIGDAGTGKTRVAGTFPKPYFFDFDKGMASLSNVEGVEFDTFKDARIGGKAMPAQGIHDYGTAWTAFEKKINEIGKLIDEGNSPYQTLVFDSITTMANLAMNFVMKSDGKSGQPPQIQHWGRQMGLLETVFDQLTAWPGIKIAIAHIQRNTNDLTQETEMLPLVTGKLAGKISVYFDEIYFAYVKRQPNKEHEYLLKTRSTSVMKSARSRWGIPDDTKPTYTELLKAFSTRS